MIPGASGYILDARIRSVPHRRKPSRWGTENDASRREMGRGCFHAPDFQGVRHDAKSRPDPRKLASVCSTPSAEVQFTHWVHHSTGPNYSLVNSNSYSSSGILALDCNSIGLPVAFSNSVERPLNIRRSNHWTANGVGATTTIVSFSPASMVMPIVGRSHVSKVGRGRRARRFSRTASHNCRAPGPQADHPKRAQMVPQALGGRRAGT